MKRTVVKNRNGDRYGCRKSVDRKDYRRGDGSAPLLGSGPDRKHLIVEGKVIVELKVVKELAPIHEAQLMTYMKLTNCKVGLLINFNVLKLKEGVRRLSLP